MPTKRLNYESALDFIMHRELFGIKLGLENISRFLKNAGNPQNRFPAVHIAGTNGKGSTAAMIASILREAGFKTGLFTSPHLVDYRERIRVNGQKINPDYIADFVDKHRRRIVRNNITFFETATALGYAYFADMDVDIAVVEVGLGGRLDATSTITPELSIITDISFDHVNILGNTLKKIAFEKAGIVKKNVPVLLGIMPDEAADEIISIASERMARLYRLEPSEFRHNGRPFVFDYQHNGFCLKKLRSSLPGFHQVRNAALAVKASEILNDIGFRVDPANISKGLRNTFWPGRFEIIKKKGKPTIICDVGHNPSGIAAMVDSFKEMYTGKKAHFVLGFVRHKDLDDIMDDICPLVKSAEIVRLKTHRTAEPEEIAGYFSHTTPFVFSESVAESVSRLVKLARADDIIIICGSHYTVGEFLEKQNEIL